MKKIALLFLLIGSSVNYATTCEKIVESQDIKQLEQYIKNNMVRLNDLNCEISFPSPGMGTIVMSGFSILHVVAHSGDAEMAGLLLSKGASPILRSSTKAGGKTALEIAQAYGNQGVIEVIKGSLKPSKL